MKNTNITLLMLTALLFSIPAYAQVGINNTSPKATLDITAKTTNGTAPEGLIPPRLTGDQIKAADAQYTAAQTGAMIYATAAVTSVSPKTANITAEGYYFFDGAAWQKVSGSDDTTNDAWMNDTANAMVKLGTLADGTTRTAGTEFVATDDGSVGIGTNSPNTSALLDLTAANKGFLPPRIALNSITDVSTISAPAEGLVVYNTGAGNLKSKGIYYWDGAQWVVLKADGGTTTSTTDLNVGETRTAVISVPTPSFIAGSAGSNKTWMNGKALTNFQTVNYLFLSEAAGSTSGFVNFGPNGALRMDIASGGYTGAWPSPKFVNTSSSPVFYSLNALSTQDANIYSGAGSWLRPGAVCNRIDGNDGFGFSTNGSSEYVNANILIHDTTDGSVRFYIGTWSLVSADDGLGHNNTFGLFTITRYK
ncbi:hypothetical protein NK356_06585 [Chryseobacterium sp. S0630]|uniref:hypothetical protein n=1 Tax=Chryseobacterium sp. S0630 TaxID=2957803 RepID=UPI00209E28F5|nr:hypothetical protein [Chryseobacterium sp. S0630]MCP1298824.1 hypothetical protein [Chryseobacterium sp. S0630]